MVLEYQCYSDMWGGCFGTRIPTACDISGRLGLLPLRQKAQCSWLLSLRESPEDHSLMRYSAIPLFRSFLHPLTPHLPSILSFEPTAVTALTTRTPPLVCFPLRYRTLSLPWSFFFCQNFPAPGPDTTWAAAPTGNCRTLGIISKR